MTNGYTKTIPELIAELKDEVREFGATRIAMLQAELREKWSSIRLALPGLLGGLLLVATAWFLFTGFLVCAIAGAFPGTSWKYAIAFVIVSALYAIMGLIALTLAWQQIKSKSMKPERTLRVLKQDQIWLQTEAKTQL